MSEGVNFVEKIRRKNSEGKVICVGLDVDPEKIPEFLMKEREYLEAVPHLKEEAILSFIKSIVLVTGDLVCAFKINRAFYDEMGLSGYRILSSTVSFIAEHYPDVPIIMDSKRGDIGNTNERHFNADIRNLPGVDAVTLNPYTGKGDSLDVFIDKGQDLQCIILCRTSNKGSGDFQSLILENGDPLYLHVAKTVSKQWNSKGNCSLVVGATYSEELGIVRDAVGLDMPILVPGVGAQGGGLEGVLENNRGGLIIINSSRGVIYAFSSEENQEIDPEGRNFAGAAREVVEGTNRTVADYKNKSL